MPDPDTICRRTRAAVEKAAMAADRARFETATKQAVSTIIAYLRAQGRDIEANRVESIRDE